MRGNGVRVGTDVLADGGAELATTATTGVAFVGQRAWDGGAL